MKVFCERALSAGGFWSNRMITFSYVDPGLGLLAWQAAVAFVVGLLFYLKKTRAWITQFFRRVFRAGKRAEPGPAEYSPSAHDVMRR
ncbi:MAG TPA: hypothetical protein VJA21_06215 [Verrucomicrobiae bacterium]